MRRPVHRLALLAIALFASGAIAQDRPPVLEPLPEPPPPPPIPGPDEPSVRIPVQEKDQVEEIRDGGRVIMLKVTPPGGNPYYLIDTTGDGNWMRRNPLDGGIRAPMWPLINFD